jgi:hypothetical protein
MKRLNQHVRLADLVGETFQLYGACENVIKLGDSNGNIVFLEAVEDPQDGWRSCLNYLRVVKNTSWIFPSLAVNVRVWGGDSTTQTLGLVLPPDNALDTIKFVDHKNHVWLTVGTDNTDDYYPCFVFRYTPSAIPIAEYTPPSKRGVIKKITSLISDFEEV